MAKKLPSTVISQVFEITIPAGTPAPFGDINWHEPLPGYVSPNGLKVGHAFGPPQAFVNQIASDRPAWLAGAGFLGTGLLRKEDGSYEVFVQITNSSADPTPEDFILEVHAVFSLRV